MDISNLLLESKGSLCSPFLSLSLLQYLDDRTFRWEEGKEMWCVGDGSILNQMVHLHYWKERRRYCELIYQVLAHMAPPHVTYEYLKLEKWYLYLWFIGLCVDALLSTVGWGCESHLIWVSYPIQWWMGMRRHKS